MFGIIVISGIMLLEGAGIYFGMKFFGSGPAAAGAASNEHSNGDGGGKAKNVPVAEVPIAEVDAFNNLSGRLYMYHLQVTALVNAANKSKLNRLIQDREATIKDRINVVIRGTDPKHLNEPGLETVRRQLQFELNKIFGDDSLILELLIPKLMQTRTRL